MILVLKEFLINRIMPDSAVCQRVIRHLADDCFAKNDIVWRRIKRPHEPSRVVLFLPKHLADEVLNVKSAGQFTVRP